MPQTSGRSAMGEVVEHTYVRQIEDGVDATTTWRLAAGSNALYKVTFIPDGSISGSYGIYEASKKGEAVADCEEIASGSFAASTNVHEKGTFYGEELVVVMTITAGAVDVRAICK